MKVVVCNEVANGANFDAVTNLGGAVEQNHSNAETEIRKSRRNFMSKFLSVLVVVALVLGSCGKDKDDDDGNGGKNGILTITGIPAEYNGKYVIVEGEDEHSFLAGFEKMVGKVEHYVKISGGEAKVPMWTMTGILKFSPYTGNDKKVELWIAIYDKASWDWGKNPVQAIFFEKEHLIKGVDFTNGNGTAKWGNGTAKW